MLNGQHWQVSCRASYLQWRHAFPRSTCFLQTSQEENLNTRVLSNLEEQQDQRSVTVISPEERTRSNEQSAFESRDVSSVEHDGRPEEERWCQVREDINLEEEYRLIFVVSYLQTLHLVPRKKIFLVHTLHVDNFSRLPHLRIIQRRRKEHQLVWLLLRLWLCKSKNDETTTDDQHLQRIHVGHETNNSETNTKENRQRIDGKGVKRKHRNKHSKQRANTHLCWILCAIRWRRIGE